MTLRTKLTDLLGIRHPILSAPMGGTAGGALASAVSRAGGLGLLGGGDPQNVPPDWLGREFAAAGNQRVGCGFITWALGDEPERLDIALRHKPAALMLSFGDPAPYLPRIKAAGIPVICQVQSLAQARQVLAQGADIIVAQGTEAGGHGARRSTLPLVPAVVDMVTASGHDVPVVAAGGIADGRGLAAALMLGASGALMGTRFHTAAESLLVPEAKRRIVAASGDGTQRTKVFDIAMGNRWPQEYNGRALVNRFIDTWHGREASLLGETAVIADYPRARAGGDYETAAVYAGEGIDLIHEVEPAEEIIQRVIAEAETALAQRFT